MARKAQDTEQTIDIPSGFLEELTRMMVANQITSRAQLAAALSGDARRDYAKECYWPEPGNLTPQFYKRMYDFNPYASRVVEVYPKACWANCPTIYDDEDSDVQTEFEKAWDALGSQLAGPLPSYYRSEEYSPIWEALQQADIFAGIGNYGVLFLGLDDGRPANEPAEPRKGMRLRFLRPYPEVHATISAIDSDMGSPRFGLPHTYRITVVDPNIVLEGTTLAHGTIDVHWSRVIHIAEGTSHPVYGIPRMRPVVNPLVDIVKVLGAGAEGYWRAAFSPLSLESHPQLGGAVRMNKDAIRQELEDLWNGLSRDLVLKGMTAKTLATAVADPSPQLRAAIEAICVYLDIPLRIFLGSERGELASSQDSFKWNSSVMGRCSRVLTPRMIVPLIDRLIHLGILPPPATGGYEAEWPDLNAASATDKADLAVKRTTAVSGYLSSGADELITPIDFLTRFLGMEESEAQAIVDAAAESLATMEEKAAGTGLIGTAEGLAGITKLFELGAAGTITEDQAKQLIVAFFGVDEATAEEMLADGFEEPEEPEPPLDENGVPIPPPNPNNGGNGAAPGTPTLDSIQNQHGRESTGSPFPIQHVLTVHGGAGSGNFGHAGRDGVVGGSGKGKGGLGLVNTVAAAPKTGGRQHEIAEGEKHNVVRMLGTGARPEEDVHEVKGQADKKPMDVRWNDPATGKVHDIEVKTNINRKDDQISVHADALLRKVNHVKETGAEFHTVVRDYRKRYKDEGGEDHTGDAYSGHDYYYKRGNGKYRLREMEPVRDANHLKELIRMDAKALPPKARGSLPPPPGLNRLNAEAARDGASRSKRNKARLDKPDRWYIVRRLQPRASKGDKEAIRELHELGDKSASNYAKKHGVNTAAFGQFGKRSGQLEAIAKAAFAARNN